MIIEIDEQQKIQKIIVNGEIVSYLYGFVFHSDLSNYIKNLEDAHQYSAVVYDGNKTRFYFNEN